MSIVLSTTRRIWLVLLFWERLPDACADCPHARPAQSALAPRAGGPSGDGVACPPGCRIVRSLRLHRIVGRRLMGLSLLVLDPRHAAIGRRTP